MAAIFGGGQPRIIIISASQHANGKRHPAIGGRVTIGAGAKVLGNIVKRTQPHHAGDAPDLNHTTLPDVFANAIRDLLARVDELENQVDGHSHPRHAHYTPVGDAWEEVDYAI